MVRIHHVLFFCVKMFRSLGLRANILVEMRPTITGSFCWFRSWVRATVRNTLRAYLHPANIYWSLFGSGSESMRDWRTRSGFTVTRELGSTPALSGCGGLSWSPAFVLFLFPSNFLVSQLCPEHAGLFKRNKNLDHHSPKSWFSLFSPSRSDWGSPPRPSGHRG